MEKQKGHTVDIGRTTGTFIEAFKIRHNYTSLDYLLCITLQCGQWNLSLTISRSILL